MTVNITIVGLGHIGASAGLALAEHADKVATTGHDLSREVERAALKLGAVGRIEHNLQAALFDADVVLSALPFDQIEPTLKLIARDVRANAVIMETGSAKASVAGWVRGLLPPDRHYVGLYPGFNPQVWEETAAGIEAARADLFRNSLIALAAPAGTPEAAVQLAAGIVILLGARPYFSDPAEVDGLAAAGQLLPGLAAAALLESIVSQPGWDDIRKLAGPAFAAGTRPLETIGAAALAEASVQNRENALRLLDGMIAALSSLRGSLASGDSKEWTARLDRLQRERQRWLADGLAGTWLAPASKGTAGPKTGDFWRQQLGGLDRLGRGGKSDEE